MQPYCLSSEVKNHKFVNSQCKCYKTSEDMVLVMNSITVMTGGKWVKSEEIRGFYSTECEDCSRKWPVHPAS